MTAAAAQRARALSSFLAEHMCLAQSHSSSFFSQRLWCALSRRTGVLLTWESQGVGGAGLA